MPEGAVCIENPVGTAPGFSMVKGQTEFFFLPGVPFEMRSLMRDAVLPKVSGDHHLFKHLTTFGLAESAVGERLFDLERLYPGVHLGYRANFPVIEVKIWAFAPPESALENAWKKASLEAEVRLGDVVISNAGGSMAEAVAALERVAGDRPRGTIAFEVDPAIQAIVDGWPRETRSGRAAALGFRADGSMDEIVRAYIEDEL